MRSLGVIKGEGFECDVIEYSDGRVHFIADADIDADGANGQFGMRPAYAVANTGSEDLANGGMMVLRGKVVLAEAWAKDIVIFGSDLQPKVFPKGVIASKTAYRFRGVAKDDPCAYVDSETVPYMVVPPLIIQKTKGIVMGCRCRVTNTQNGRVSEGVVADIGPRKKIGEVSIQMARELGIPESPRHGGEDSPIIRFELWPGVAALVNGVSYPLQSAV